jgi:hypothetical protein
VPADVPANGLRPAAWGPRLVRSQAGTASQIGEKHQGGTRLQGTCVLLELYLGPIAVGSQEAANGLGHAVTDAALDFYCLTFRTP